MEGANKNVEKGIEDSFEEHQKSFLHNSRSN